MKTNYYAVTVKCGHVGRNNFIRKTLPIYAIDAKDAARKARAWGRVKHDLKDAIEKVEPLTEEQYSELKRQKDNDSYFQVQNVQQQRVLCEALEDQVIAMDALRVEEDVIKPRLSFHKSKKEKITIRETVLMLRDFDERYLN